MPDDVPARPRLADHVIARLHKARGEDVVALHDQQTGRTFRLGPREWTLLSVADGTRDVEGVRLAGAREGAPVRADLLRAFLADLGAAGLLDDGPPEATEPAPMVNSGLPLDALAGYRFQCDGRGTCCRQYGTVVFSPMEAARARVLLPMVLDGGEHHDRMFAPEHGSAPAASCAVKHVDGACAYLGDKGWCSIHSAGGAAAKPFGCGLFPSRFVDDGEAVRVTALVECACVVRSLDAAEGDPLVAEGMRVRGDLPAEVFVEALPERVALTPEADVARAEFVAWTRAALAAGPPQDLVAWAWALADEAAGGALPSPAGAWSSGVGPSFEAVAPWLAGWASFTEEAAARSSEWRSDSDVVLLAFTAMAETAAMLRDDRAFFEQIATAGAAQPAAEALYFRASLHGYGFVTGRPFASQLREVAVRLLVARAMARLRALGALEPAAFEEPIALVEAICRGYGVANAE